MSEHGVPLGDGALKASILINNYNYGHYLRQCIDSALAQTYRDLEVVVVDDGSTDNSRDIIESYGNRVIALFKENGGQASCFNAGFARSKGEIIFLLDADDEFHPNKVAVIADVYRRLDVQWCCDLPDLAKMPTDPAGEAAAEVELFDARTTIADGKLPWVPAATSGLSFRRNLLAKILPMPTAGGITLSDNYLKFAAAGLGKGAVCKMRLTHQRVHGGNRYTGSDQIRRRQSEIMMATGIQLTRHYPFLANIGVKLVSTALAGRIADDPGQLPELLRGMEGSPFRRGEKIRIALLAAAKAVRLILQAGIKTQRGAWSRRMAGLAARRRSGA